MRGRYVVSDLPAVWSREPICRISCSITCLYSFISFTHIRNMEDRRRDAEKARPQSEKPRGQTRGVGQRQGHGTPCVTPTWKAFLFPASLWPSGPAPPSWVPLSRHPNRKTKDNHQKVSWARRPGLQS